MEFRKIVPSDFSEWSELISELWELNLDEQNEEFTGLINNPRQIGIGCFTDKLVGVVHVSLRYEYVNGTESSPVGYIEGIVVTKNQRNNGIASLLLTEAEKYAKSKNCLEMGSDLDISNETSLNFHKKNGYIEKERVICLSKKISGGTL